MDCSFSGRICKSWIQKDAFALLKLTKEINYFSFPGASACRGIEKPQVVWLSKLLPWEEMQFPSQSHDICYCSLTWGWFGVVVGWLSPMWIQMQEVSHTARQALLMYPILMFFLNHLFTISHFRVPVLILIMWAFFFPLIFHRLNFLVVFYYYNYLWYFNTLLPLVSIFLLSIIWQNKFILHHFFLSIAT